MAAAKLGESAVCEDKGPDAITSQVTIRRMQILALLVAANLTLASLLPAAAPPKKKAATPGRAVVRTSGRSAVKAIPKSSARSRAAYSRYRAPARPVAQQVPTQDRYKDIQQKLADKGYYKGTVDGQWNPDSVDALKHFQADQNLHSDGRIDSLSLIGLGLGPKRMTAQSTPPVDKQ